MLCAPRYAPLELDVNLDNLVLADVVNQPRAGQLRDLLEPRRQRLRHDFVQLSGLREPATRCFLEFSETQSVYTSSAATSQFVIFVVVRPSNASSSAS